MLHTPNHEAEISFLEPNHPSQQAIFQNMFLGQGVYLIIEVDDTDKIYEEFKKQKNDVRIDIRDEPWGEIDILQ